MARGWESKSVEEQQSQLADSSTRFRPQLTPDQIARSNVRQGLLLTRARILQQIATATNLKHRSMLENALADIDAKIAQLG